MKLRQITTAFSTATMVQAETNLYRGDETGTGQNDMFWEASQRPNATNTVPFQFRNQTWQMRINVTELAVANLMNLTLTDNTTVDQATSFKSPNQINTVFDLLWPGDEGLNDTLDDLNSATVQDPNDRAHLCTSFFDQLFPSNVTNNWKDGDNCTSAFGEECMKEFMASYENATPDPFTGCRIASLPTDLPLCSGSFFSAQEAHGIDSFSLTGFYVQNHTYLNRSAPLSSGSPIFYHSGPLYEAGNTTEYERATERLYLNVLSTAGIFAPVCGRVKTDKVDYRSPATTSAQSSEMGLGDIMRPIWFTVAVAVIAAGLL